MYCLVNVERNRRISEVINTNVVRTLGVWHVHGGAQ